MAERTSSDSWAEYRRLVLAALERNDEEIAELKKLVARMDNLEKLGVALKRTVYGSAEDATKSLRNRVQELERFREEHPTLQEESAETEGKRTNKKMLVLLVGAISGLVALAAKLVDVISDLLGKLGG